MTSHINPSIFSTSSTKSNIQGAGFRLVSFMHLIFFRTIYFGYSRCLNTGRAMCISVCRRGLKVWKKMSKRMRSPSPLSLYSCSDDMEETKEKNEVIQMKDEKHESEDEKKIVPEFSVAIHNTYYTSILYESEQRMQDLLKSGPPKRHFQKGSDLGYVDIGVKSEMDNMACMYRKHYMYVIDTSGSMLNSNRMNFAKLGLEASCKMIAEDARVTIINFSDTANVLYSGPNPSFVMMDDVTEGDKKRMAKKPIMDFESERKDRTPTMHRILSSLNPQGGTNIVDAIRLSTQECKKYLSLDKEDDDEGNLEVKRSITIMLMTDGEDSNMGNAIAIQKKKRNHDDDKRSSDKDGCFLKLMDIEAIADTSGIQMHIVGISQDASACDLAFLAEKVNGTFVCVKNRDIVDVMGTLIGFVEEKVPNTLLMDIKFDVPGDFYLLKKHHVQLITSKTSKIAFKLPLSHWQEIEEWKEMNLVVKLYVVPLGKSVDKFYDCSPCYLEVRKQLTFVDSAMDASYAHKECIVQEAFRLWGVHNQEITGKMYVNRNSMSNECVDLNRMMKTQVLELKEFFFNSKVSGEEEDEDDDKEKKNQMDVVLGWIEEQYRGLERCMEDRKFQVELEQRILSDASTHRNSSLSLDPLLLNESSNSSFTSTPTSGFATSGLSTATTMMSRSLSQSQVQARNRIRTISSTLSDAFEKLCASTTTEEEFMD